MRNKVLVVTSNLSEYSQFEKALEGIVNEGGELFLTQNKKEGQLILKKEHPQLLFLEASLMDSSWELKETRLILLCNEIEPKSDSDYLMRPLIEKQILAVCHTTLKKEFVPPERPM